MSGTKKNWLNHTKSQPIYLEDIAALRRSAYLPVGGFFTCCVKILKVGFPYMSHGGFSELVEVERC